MIDEARVLKAAFSSLGAKEKDPPAEALLARVYRENASSFAPRSVCALFRVRTEESEGVRFERTDVFLKGESIKKHLAGATYALFQAFTLGALADKRIKELSFSRPSESVALNAIASVYAELSADEMLQKEKENLEENGYRFNFRFCPGYGDLSLAANGEIAGVLLASKKIGLSVSEDGLLLPRKSIVGVCGAFERRVGE